MNPTFEHTHQRCAYFDPRTLRQVAHEARDGCEAALGATSPGHSFQRSVFLESYKSTQYGLGRSRKELFGAGGLDPRKHCDAPSGQRPKLPCDTPQRAFYVKTDQKTKLYAKVCCAGRSALFLLVVSVRAGAEPVLAALATQRRQTIV